MRKLPSGPWWPVLIYFPGYDTCLGYCKEFTLEDCIPGNNPLDALQNAAWNWPDAEWVEIQWYRGVAI